MRGGPSRSPIEITDNDEKLLKQLVSRREWKRPPDMMRVHFKDPATLGHLLRMVWQTGKFRLLVYIEHLERWQVQFKTEISGPYPTGETPQKALAKALLMIWIEEAGA